MNEQRSRSAGWIAKQVLIDSGVTDPEALNREYLRAQSKDSYDKKREYHLEHTRRWREKNKPKIAISESIYKKANADKVRANMRAWRARNQDKVKANKTKSLKKKLPSDRIRRSRWETKQWKTSPEFRLKKTLKVRLQSHLGTRKARESTFSITGCSPQFFKKWIESNFSDGMSFDLRSHWNIDHVFPLSCCEGPDDIKKASHYLNLYPVPALKNRIKYHKLTEKSIVCAFLCGISKIILKDAHQATEELVSKALALGITVERKY